MQGLKAACLLVWVCLLPIGGWGEDLRQDLGNLVSYRNLAIAAGGVGLAGIAHAWDKDLEGDLRGNPLIDAPSYFTDVYGSSLFNLPLSLGMWGIGKWRGQAAVEEAGSAVLRALIVTQAVVGPIKWTVRRQRPDESNRLSFPSGHTANSFAVARLMQKRYGQKVGVPLYVLGSVVALGRMEGERHYLSDVVMGAVLGVVVGEAVSWKMTDRIKVVPRMGKDAKAVALRVQF